MKDSVGDRQKMLESQPLPLRFDTHMPVVARMDGRAFHQFTKGLARPYDTGMVAAMSATMEHLVKETGACIGYTQSDEITLVWAPVATPDSGWFGRRAQKMLSQLGAQTTLAFYRHVEQIMPEYANKWPTFDARIWSVPSFTDVIDNLLWRERDDTKNSVSMAASTCFSHKQLLNVDTEQKIAMLEARGITWSNYPVFFKRGLYAQRRTVVRPFSATEIDQLPAKHAARANPDLLVERSEIQFIDMPPFNTVRNQVDVVFNGAEPITQNE